MKKFDCTDSGNVERLLAYCGNRFRYVPTWQRFMVWDGVRWVPDPKGTQLLGMTAEVAERVKAEAAAADDKDEADRLWSWWSASRSAARRKAMVELSRGEAAALARPETFDARPMLFNAENGTIDLTTGELHPFKSADMLTQVADVVFNPKAKAPLWEQFLAEVLPDPEVREFLQTYVGYCLSGSVKERLIVVFYGLGRNGKSVLLRVLYSLLGPYCGTIRPDMLLAKGHDPHPTEEAALLGKRLVVTSEVQKGRRFDEQKVKGLTGGDVRAARRMHEDFWDLTPTAKIIVAANHKPGVSDASDSFWDRMALVPFKVRIPDEKVDKDLLDKLSNELPGILNWAVAGAVRWSKNGITVPAAIRDAGDSYRASEDRLAEFFADCIEFTPLGQLKHSDVMELAKEWAGKNNVFVPSDKAIGERLQEGGAERYRSNNARYWRGISARNTKTKSAKPPWMK